MARKRKRVPEILWRLFHNRARSLADTILALVPSPPVSCQCKRRRRRCLSCSSDQALSFLLRPDDPIDYRRLLNKCFVVVSENAPPSSVFDPQSRWSQPEIVKRSIEMILYEEPSSSNLICSSYDKEKGSSAFVDLLTSSPWILLLRRVGDALMIYLLKHTSLFLPMPGKKHLQVAGLPISDLCYEFCRHISDGLRKKRKEKVELTSEEQLTKCSLGFSHSSSSISSVGSDSNCRSYSVHQLSTVKNKISEKSPENDAIFSGSSCVLDKELSLIKYTGSFQQNFVSSRKRVRYCRWQRHRKRRHLDIEGTIPLVACRGNCSRKYNLSGEVQNELSATSGQSNETNTSPCFCCLVFENVPKVEKTAQIDRKRILYKLENSTLMFPRKYILYTLKPNDSGALFLFNSIFGTFGYNINPKLTPCVYGKSISSAASTCLYHYLIKLFKILIRKTRNCRYLKLLDKHCPITSSYQDAWKGAPAVEENNTCPTLRKSGHEAQNEGELVDAVPKAENSKMTSKAFSDHLVPSKGYCQKKQVVSFVWAVCRRIVPSPLLGTTANWRILRKNIYKFVNLRKFEKFSLKECMQKMKLSKIPLLSKRHCEMHNNCCAQGITDTARRVILECWVFWFFAHLVSPLVQSNFYITESELEKQNVSYYRKSSWKKLMREAEKYLMDQRYLQLNHSSLRKILGNRSFGFSRARIRPKQIGFRLLANLQAPSRILVTPPRPRIHSNHQLPRKAVCNKRKVQYNFFKSVNSVLHDLHVVLKGIRVKEPEKLGSSVFDYNDVYKKLVPFLLFLKNRYTNMPGVFIVVSDVSKAFDSVNLDKLISVMNEVIVDDEYTLEKFIQVTRTKEFLKVHQQIRLAPQDTLIESTSLTSQLPAYSSLDSILVKKSLSRKVQKEEFNLILREHITRNVVQFGNNFYMQCIGIPQGSVLSTLLCSFYYGHMERNVIFPFLEKAGEDFLSTQPVSALVGDRPEEILAYASRFLLLRFVDDFLFISTSRKLASMFFFRLERGVREYNCCMNKEKYGLNFNINNEQSCPSNRLHVLKDGVSFLRWSGLLVNCSTLEIQADYTRYMNSHLSSTLTVSRIGKVGRQLKLKLRHYIRPKCHPIFYDSNINSAGVVRLNIYQVFLLCAMKFVCYISNLSSFPRFGPKFFRNAIDESLRYMNRLVKRKMYSFDAGIAIRPKYEVKKQEIMWLGLYAFCGVLKKKQSRYGELLHLLRSELKAYGKVDNTSSELKYAVDDSHSSVLWSIKY